VGLMLLIGITPMQMRESSSIVRHDEPCASHFPQRVLVAKRDLDKPAFSSIRLKPGPCR
jgi:hypothetical protein